MLSPPPSNSDKQALTKTRLLAANSYTVREEIMKYAMSEKAWKIVEETATTARLLTRLFPDNTISVEHGIMFIGDDLIALHSALETLADKLSDLQYESETLDDTKI